MIVTIEQIEAMLQKSVIEELVKCRAEAYTLRTSTYTYHSAYFDILEKHPKVLKEIEAMKQKIKKIIPRSSAYSNPSVKVANSNRRYYDLFPQVPADTLACLPKHESAGGLLLQKFIHTDVELDVFSRRSYGGSTGDVLMFSYFIQLTIPFKGEIADLLRNWKDATEAYLAYEDKMGKLNKVLENIHNEAIMLHMKTTSSVDFSFANAEVCKYIKTL